MRRTSVAAVLAVLLAAMVTVAPTASADTSSSAINDWTCRPSAAHPEPVVLLHGLFANKDGSWGVAGPSIAAAGYCVFSLTYGEYTPGTGVGGVRPVDESAHTIGAFVDRVIATTGADKVDLVGHSEGGLETEYVTKVLGYAPKVARVVALAPPTHGTTASGLTHLKDPAGKPYLATVEDLAKCQGCSDVLHGSATIARLNAGPIAQPGVKYTVIASRNDHVVTPPASSFINEPGVTNRYVQDTCPFDLVGHIGLPFDTAVIAMVLNALGTPTPVVCSVGLPS